MLYHLTAYFQHSSLYYQIFVLYQLSYPLLIHSKNLVIMVSAVACVLRKKSLIFELLLRIDIKSSANLVVLIIVSVVLLSQIITYEKPFLELTISN